VTGQPSPGNVLSQVVFLVRSGRPTASKRKGKGMSTGLLVLSDNSTHVRCRSLLLADITVWLH